MDAVHAPQVTRYRGQAAPFWAQIVSYVVCCDVPYSVHAFYLLIAEGLPQCYF